MYATLWRILPGPAVVRALIMLVLAAAVIYACFTWLFPWVSEKLPMNDAGVHQEIVVAWPWAAWTVWRLRRESCPATPQTGAGSADETSTPHA